MRPHLRSWPTRIRHAARTARMALRPRAVILLYHRVATPAMDPLLLSVTPANFATHLEILRRDFHPLTLAQLAAAVQAGNIPDRSVVLTFDDGYADNLEAAAPLLAARGMQATLFASGACLAEGTLYHDELEDILLGSADLPRTLHLSLGGEDCAWDFGAWARLPENPGREYFAWNLEWQDDPSPRHCAYREIFGLLRGASQAVRESVLCALRHALHAKTPASRRLLTAAQLRLAAQGGTLEIGAHTRNHLALNKLPLAEQREEIEAGKHALEQTLGRPVTVFAYPYGSPWDVSGQTVTLVRESGFALACANTPAPVDRESDPYWLPRCLVRNWNGEEFTGRLEEFFRPRAEGRPQG